MTLPRPVRLFEALCGLTLAAMLAGCGGNNAGGAASPSTASAGSAATPASGAGAGSQPASATPADWEKLVAAAKAEGTVAVLTPPGDELRQFFDAFQKKYGITVKLNVGNGQGDLLPKIQTERRAGIYSWDVMVHSPSLGFNGLKPEQALEPLRPAIVLPEVMDDSKWVKGFDAGWADSEKSLVYAFTAEIDWTAYVNRNIAPESQLNKLDQLWEPQWKGKVAWQDPRVPGKGSGRAADIMEQKGEDKLRALLQDQQPVLTSDRRQLAEWVVRGQYPVAITLDWNILGLFNTQGIDFKHVKPLADDDPAAAGISSSSGGVALLNGAPHPNAAKVLINWVLSQEGQALYAQLTGHNSRRLDVAAVNSVIALDPKKNYVAKASNEVDYSKTLKALALAKEFLK